MKGKGSLAFWRTVLVWLVWAGDTAYVYEDPVPPFHELISKTVKYALKCLNCSGKVRNAGLNVAGVSKAKKEAGFIPCLLCLQT